MIFQALHTICVCDSTSYCNRDDDCDYCNGITPAPNTTTAPPPPNCPHDWLDLGHLGCMHFVQDVEIMNWFAAQVYCNALNPNAFLAEIFSYETQLVVAALASELPSYVWWLGATDFYKEGTWIGQKRTEKWNSRLGMKDNLAMTWTMKIA